MAQKDSLSPTTACVIINLVISRKERRSGETARGGAAMTKSMEYYKITEGPYSDVVVVDDDFLFLSGLVSENLETGEAVSGDITTETCQTLNNLETILKQHGSDMEHVIRVEVILADFSERDEMNAEYVRHFSPDRMPARVCYGNVGLAGGCKIELMAIARKAK